MIYFIYKQFNHLYKYQYPLYNFKTNCLNRLKGQYYDYFIIKQETKSCKI